MNKTYQVCIVRSYKPRYIYTDSLARAVISLIKSSRRSPNHYVELSVTGEQKLLASYNDSDKTYCWQNGLEQPQWQRYINHKLQGAA
jgi:hypothetical protein